MRKDRDRIVVGGFAIIIIMFIIGAIIFEVLDWNERQSRRSRERIAELEQQIQYAVDEKVQLEKALSLLEVRVNVLRTRLTEQQWLGQERPLWVSVADSHFRTVRFFSLAFGEDRIVWVENGREISLRVHKNEKRENTKAEGRKP